MVGRENKFFKYVIFWTIFFFKGEKHKREIFFQRNKYRTLPWEIIRTLARLSFLKFLTLKFFYLPTSPTEFEYNIFAVSQMKLLECLWRHSTLLYYGGRLIHFGRFFKATLELTIFSLSLIQAAMVIIRSSYVIKLCDSIRRRLISDKEIFRAIIR